MKSEAARLFVYQVNVSLFWSAVFLTSNFIVLLCTDLRSQRILISKHNSLWVVRLSWSVKVGFTDFTISILEKSHSLHFFEAYGASDFVRMRRPQRSHGYYCAVCPFSSGGNIMQQKKPDAFYDLCRRPIACGRVIIIQDWAAGLRVCF